MFSFMGPQHGRILQVYFDGSELVIYKSKLYDFKNEETAPVKLFLQYSHEHTIWGNHIFADPFTEGVTVAGLEDQNHFCLYLLDKETKFYPSRLTLFRFFSNEI